MTEPIHLFGPDSEGHYHEWTMEQVVDAGTPVDPMTDEDLPYAGVKSDQGGTIAVVLEGGLVQSVLSDAPANVLVIDYDIEGADEDDLTQITFFDGKTEEAQVSLRTVDEPGLDLKKLCNQLL